MNVASVPAKSARQCWPFPVFHGECLCQTEQAFGQTRGGFSICAAEALCGSAGGAAQQRRFFSWAFPDRNPEFRRFPRRELRQNITTEAFSGGGRSVSC